MSDAVIQIVASALLTSAKIAGPVLITSLVVGLLLSVIQSATQIQEQTLTFLPKLVACGLVLVLTGAWTLRVLTSFTHELFASVPTLLSNG